MYPAITYNNAKKEFVKLFCTDKQFAQHTDINYLDAFKIISVLAANPDISLTPQDLDKGLYMLVNAQQLELIKNKVRVLQNIEVKYNAKNNQIPGTYSIVTFKFFGRWCKYGVQTSMNGDKRPGTVNNVHYESYGHYIYENFEDITKVILQQYQEFNNLCNPERIFRTAYNNILVDKIAKEIAESTGTVNLRYLSTAEFIALIYKFKTSRAILDTFKKWAYKQNLSITQRELLKEYRFGVKTGFGGKTKKIQEILRNAIQGLKSNLLDRFIPSPKYREAALKIEAEEKGLTYNYKLEDNREVGTIAAKIKHPNQHRYINVNTRKTRKTNHEAT